VTVQPYGLTAEQRQAFADAAARAEARLAQKRICFIGMWGPRKGSHDWAEIIHRVRAEVPEARFRFLGTMVDAARIQAELGADAAESLELISTYDPGELPALLADCAVGAFPSYVEGFGIAVIEQLAAGIPTVAYDTAGPRDILGARLGDLLVTSGDLAALSAALVRLLRVNAADYEQLSQTSRDIAAQFSWPEIARETIGVYRRLLHERARPVVFVQPFSLGSAGGGARILRALLEQAPMAWRSICSSPARPKPWRDELHIRGRPSWGPLEHSRFAGIPHASAAFFRRGFARRLRRCCERIGATAIHAVPHAGLDFAVGQDVAEALRLPFFISLHDDLAYTAVDAVRAQAREPAMKRAWQQASARFVISEALGREYSRRYGERPFEVVTDGLTELQPVHANGAADTLRIYFMGLFHMAYERNLRALLEGIARFQRQHPARDVRLTLRCEHVRPQVLNGATNVTVLPFAPEAQVQRDMREADLLYMPIPFGEEHANFARYSLSTKMVTYVGSGVPILYHGPAESAAFALLHKHEAAVSITTLEPDAIVNAFSALTSDRRATVSANALELARREFMLADQARKFWGTIEGALASK
jgi:hypothetical protein